MQDFEAMSRAQLAAALKEARRALEGTHSVKESERLYRSLFENTGAATVLYDDDGLIRKCNTKFEFLAGLPKEDILGKRRWTDFVDKAELERMWAYHQQRVREGGTSPKEYTFTFVAHGGEKKHIHVTVGVVEESNARIASLVDISPLKRAEAELYAAKNEFESIFQNSQVGIMLLRGGRTLSRGNQHLADILGYASPEEMAGVSMSQLHLNEHNYREFGEKYYNALSQNEQLQIEYQIRRKDGSAVWCSISGKALDPSDLDKGVIWIIDDISEHKRAEAALREARNDIRDIIDSMPSMLVGVDASGRVTHWNDAARRATGLAPDKARGRRVGALLPWLGDGVCDLLADLRPAGPRTFDSLPVAEDGGTRYKDVTLYPLNGPDRQGAVIIVDDVTERMRMEEVLVQNEKMMSVGGLAAGMAHEINNPLGGVLGAAQNIINRVDPGAAPNRRVGEELGIDVADVHRYLERRGILRFLEGVRESSARAADIVRNMLDFSRASSKEKKPCDLRGLLDDAVQLAAKDYSLRTRHDFKDIAIVREYAPDPPEVPVIASEIKQVFLNLLTNAAQAMDERTRATGDAAITLRIVPKREYVRVDIQDNGKGIDAMERKRVFEPFYTTKAPGEGTGLGLSVSYFIVTRNHGGTLTVESAPGKGTTFSVRLPSCGSPSDIPDPRT